MDSFFGLGPTALIIFGLGFAGLGIKGSWFLLHALLWGPLAANARRAPYRHAMSCYFAGIPALLGASFFVYALYGGHNPFEFELEDSSWLKTSMGFYLFAFVASPVLEELLFRGLLQGWLSKHPAFGPQRAIVFSAVVFAACHGLAAAFPLFLLGLILGWVRWSTGSLPAAMLVHAVHNMAALLPYIWLS